MKLLILSILITLSHSNDNEKDFLKAGKKTVSLLKDYISTGKQLNKYLGAKNVKDEYDVQVAKSKAKVLQRARKSTEKFDELLNIVGDGNYEENRLQSGYLKDPVLNELKMRRRRYSSSEDSASHSSSRELKEWKTEWRENWIKKKIAAFNATPPPTGEIINMVAARPWGTPCGDPNQHDMPWGTCVLPVECDAEYRIYRGDYFCGRTQFICCSLSFSTYDTYQAFDVSLQDSELITDSEELRERKRRESREKKKGDRRDRRRRRRIRDERKRKIRRTIKRIITEVKKILNRAYRNGTKLRRKKTKTMKKFIKYLKKQYKKDRDSAKDIHEHQMYVIDRDLMKKLMEIKEVNHDFMNNNTFREIIVNGTMNLKAARMLAQAYPELSSIINGNIIRRLGIYKLPTENDNPRSAEVISSAPRNSQSDVKQLGGYATPPSGPKIQGSDVVVPRNMKALRRRQQAIRRSGLAMRGGRVVTRPYRRRNRDYDVEYGLLYS